MDCGEELDIAIKQSANLTNWRLNFFPQDRRQALLQPLKHRERRRGAERAGALVVRKKNP